MDAAPSFFTLMATGQVESAEVSTPQTVRIRYFHHTRHPLELSYSQIPYCQSAYCKYEIVAGEDWQILDGMDNGITQVARQSSGAQPERWFYDSSDDEVYHMQAYAHIATALQH